LKVRDRGEGVFNVDDWKKLKVESAEQMLAILYALRSNRDKGETNISCCNKAIILPHSIRKYLKTRIAEIEISTITHIDNFLGKNV
jgi:hypothetical protein